MKDHPADPELQQYALDKSGLSVSNADHIEFCPRCKAEVDTYRMLFSEIRNQPAACFDFDLSGLVIQQLSKTNARHSVDNIIAYFLVAFSCFCIGIPVYLFRQNILNMFTGIPPFFIYAIIGSTSIILIIKILFMFKKYQNQMRLINFNQAG
ncbi:MAG TPA: hypothetical protein VIL90_00735 [Puia sp.]|jgi:hypothetical protein